MTSLLSGWLLPTLTFVTLLLSVRADTVVYNFNVTWTKANPDGAFERSVIGINNQWPIPTITANVNDTVIVNVHNQLGNETTGLHFHGLLQNGTNQMDGPSMVTQCDIPPGHSFTYNFTIQQPGTYWYHSHTHAQYPDGIRGPLVIHDPNNPYANDFDEEVILSVSDWYHDHMSALVPWFMSKANPSGAEPVPNAALINETQNFKFKIEPNKTYFVRMVNIGAFAGQYIWFEGHTMRIVEVDGVYTQEGEAEMIYLSAAQRCSFLLTTKNETDVNYAFMASMDTTLFDLLPEDLDYNVTGWLTYDETAPFPSAEVIDEFYDFDDMSLIPYDEEELLPEPDRIITLNVIMDNLGDGANYAWFNNITYTTPKTPSLYTALSAGELATDPTVYGPWTNPFVLEKDEVVQIVVNNLDPGRHPFHLHGHHFQAIYRSEEEGGIFHSSSYGTDFPDENGDDAEDAVIVPESALPKAPMRRDTLVVQPNGNIVLRFRANNPGLWLFHCHIEWHVVSGLIATMVEAPLELQEILGGEGVVPSDHKQACEKQGIVTEGNAAGNKDNFLDLTGMNVPPERLPDGFTARGIVALIFSCIAGILGVAVVAWYGFAEAPPSAPRPFATSRAAGKTVPDTDLSGLGSVGNGRVGEGDSDEIQVASPTGGGGARR